MNCDSRGGGGEGEYIVAETSHFASVFSGATYRLKEKHYGKPAAVLSELNPAGLHSCLTLFTQKSPSQYHTTLPFQLPLQMSIHSGLLLKYILFPESKGRKMGRNTMISPSHLLETGKVNRTTLK